jgi:predicted CopG family antitoxin
MATKTISITTEAYDILKSWQENGESFSKIITKLKKRRNLSDFSNMLTKDEAKELEDSYEQGRKLSLERAKQHDS